MGKERLLNCSYLNVPYHVTRLMISFSGSIQNLYAGRITSC